MIKIAIRSESEPANSPAAMVRRVKAVGADALDVSSGLASALIALPISSDAPVAVVRASSIDSLLALVEPAASVGAGWICVPAPLQRIGESRGAAIMKFNRQLAPIADAAADRGIGLLVENTNSFRASNDLWSLIDQLNHPSVACSWDEANGSAIGQTPSLVVPTLNSRIVRVVLEERLVLARDAMTHALLNRLLGIGFDGMITVEQTNQSDDELTSAVAILREWIAPRKKKVARAR